MSQICEDYKKLIEEKVEKPIEERIKKTREKCKKKKCKKWCLCCNKWVCWLETFFLTVVKWVVTIVLKWVVYLVCWIITTLIDLLRAVVDFLAWLAGRILALPELTLCLTGKRLGTKHLRIDVFVIADEKDNPIVPISTIEAHIAKAKEIYRVECQLTVHATKPMVVTDATDLLTSHDCSAAGWFSPKKGVYDSFSILGRLAAIYVRNVPGGSAGCHIPGTDYVLVDKEARDDTLAHEIGHACNLLRHRDGTPSNLMASGSVRTGTNLTRWQACVVRTSSRVTWL